MVDWESIALKLGVITVDPATGTYSERYGDKNGQEALEEILGPQFWIDAIDSYVNDVRGGGVIISILRTVRPKSGMQRCYEIYKSQTEIKDRRYVLTLLNQFADFSATKWASEFLQDPDEDINVWGACLLDKLLLNNWGDPPSEFEIALNEAEAHQSKRVRDTVSEHYIRQRYIERLSE